MKLRLTRYGKTGWEFSVTFDQQTHRYRTNPAGGGLWKHHPSNASYPDGTIIWGWGQIYTASEFWLPENRKRAYDKIRYAWRKETS